jgi:hypothetical protein
LAGCLAEIGHLLGIACGSNKGIFSLNKDLTYDGAKNWLITIPKIIRQEVHYHTTQYKDWHWCNIAVNAFLSWPNDGGKNILINFIATELKKAALLHGKNAGNKKAWCHTDGMTYPNQNHDEVRNKHLNEHARRH